MDRLILLTVLLLPALAARADCEPALVGTVLGQLHYTPKYDDNHHLVDAIIRCQPMASDPGKSVLALSLRHPAQDQHNDHYDIYSLDVAVFRSYDGVVLSRYSKPDEFLSDAVALLDIKLDMGRYELAGDVRAFGVRADYSISGLSVYDYQALTLFVNKGNSIAEVLSGLVTAKIHYDGGYGPRCTAFSGETQHLYAGQLVDLRRNVTVAPEKSNGFADLLITESTKTTTTRNEAGTCVKTIDPPSQTRLTLHYDGSAYGLPGELRAN